MDRGQGDQSIVRVEDLFTLDNLSQYENETRRKQEKRSKKRKRKEDDVKKSPRVKRKVEKKESPKEEETNYLNKSLEAIGSLLHIGRKHYRSHESVAEKQHRHEKSHKHKSKKEKSKATEKDDGKTHKSKKPKKEDKRDTKVVEEKSEDRKIKQKEDRKEKEDGEDGETKKDKRSTKRKEKEADSADSDGEKNKERNEKHKRKEKKEDKPENVSKHSKSESKKQKSASLEDTPSKSKEPKRRKSKLHVSYKDLSQEDDGKSAKDSKNRHKENKMPQKSSSDNVEKEKIIEKESIQKETDKFTSDSTFLRTLSKMTGLGLLSSFVIGDKKKNTESEVFDVNTQEYSRRIGSRQYSSIEPGTRKDRGEPDRSSHHRSSRKPEPPKNAKVPRASCLRSDHRNDRVIAEAKRAEPGDVSSDDCSISTMELLALVDVASSSKSIMDVCSRLSKKSTCSSLAIQTDFVDNSLGSITDFSKEDLSEKSLTKEKLNLGDNSSSNKRSSSSKRLTSSESFMVDSSLNLTDTPSSSMVVCTDEGDQYMHLKSISETLEDTSDLSMDVESKISAPPTLMEYDLAVAGPSGIHRKNVSEISLPLTLENVESRETLPTDVNCFQLEVDDIDMEKNNVSKPEDKIPQEDDKVKITADSNFSRRNVYPRRVESDVLLENMRQFKSELMEDLRKVKSSMQHDFVSFKSNLVQGIVNELDDCICGPKKSIPTSRSISKTESTMPVSEEVDREHHAGGDCIIIDERIVNQPRALWKTKTQTHSGEGDGDMTAEEESSYELIWPERILIEQKETSVFHRFRTKFSRWRVPKIKLKRVNFVPKKSKSVCTGTSLGEIPETKGESRETGKTKSALLHPTITRRDDMNYGRIFSRYRNRRKKKTVATPQDLPGLPEQVMTAKLSPEELINNGAGRRDGLPEKYRLWMMEMMSSYKRQNSVHIKLKKAFFKIMAQDVTMEPMEVLNLLQRPNMTADKLSDTGIRHFQSYQRNLTRGVSSSASDSRMIQRGPCSKT